MNMRNPFGNAVAGLIALLALSPVAKAQVAQGQVGQVEQHPPSVYQSLNDKGKPAGPAPKRDLNGSWAGPIGSSPRDIPPMTPAGQAAFALNKPENKYTLAGTNDPFVVCDPLGMPRKILDQTRGVCGNTQPHAPVVAIRQGVARNLDGRARPPEKRWREARARSQVVRILGRTLGKR